MPGATAYGSFAKSPIARVHKAADHRVAAIAASFGIPDTSRIEGLTKMI